MSSFLKFTSETNGNGRGEIHWGRARQDGAPYRGHGVPLLRDHEFEELSEQVWDSYHGTFDTSKPEMVQPSDSVHGRTLQFIIEAKENNWFRLLDWNTKWIERDGEPVMYVFVVWSEKYQEISPATIEGKINSPISEQGSIDVQSHSSPGSSPPALL